MKIFYLLAVVIFFWLNFNYGLYGLDWTDSTYHYQAAQNVIDGKVPHRDFHAPVPGLSFVIEAQLLELVGNTYYVHRVLGFVILLLGVMGVCLAVAVWLVRESTKSKAVVVLAYCISLLNTQAYFNYTDLGHVAAIWVLATFGLIVNREERSRELFLVCVLGFLLAFTFSIKQSYGAPLFLAVLVLLPMTLYFRFQSFKNGVLIRLFALVFSFLASMSLFVTCISGKLWYGPLVGVSGGLQLKGLSLSEPIEIIKTIIGVSSTETFVLFISSFFASFVVFHQSLRFPLLQVFICSGLIFAAVLCASFAALESYLSFLIHYTCVSLLSYSVYFTIRYFKSLSRSRVSCIMGYSTLGFVPIVSAQLSWPGIGYVISEYSIFYLLVLYILIISEVKAEFFSSHLYGWFVVAVFCLFVSVSVIGSVKEYRVYEWGGSHIELTQPSEFLGWRVHPDNREVVEKLQYHSDQCAGNSMFQIPWAPVVYILTGRVNVTKYDLPYHDIIDERHADEIINTLEVSLPELIVIEPNYYDYQGPFPALGMKKILAFLGAGYLKDYELVASLGARFKTFEIYCRNSSAETIESRR
ncbi:MAG: hypothetical protein MI867_13805 [Pseudomonadales bacterium]|nr:hypothetical protein [Pseudomonadales bacterium]